MAPVAVFDNWVVHKTGDRQQYSSHSRC